MGFQRKITIALLLSTIGNAQSAADEGIAAFKEGRYSLALAKLKGTKDPTGSAFLALAQAATGDCKSALLSMAALQPQDPVLQRLIGLAQVKCYGATGDNAHAFALSDQLQKQYPNDADVHYTAAKLHMKAFNDATFAMFQRTPASYRVHELSAEIFETQNRYAEAISEYRKAIELNPKAPDLHFRLGRAILLQSHDAQALDGAATEFQSELKLSPEDSASEFQLGQIALVKNNYADAKTRFERALTLSPNFVQAQISLAKVHLQEKNYAQAIRLLTQATTAQPANESAHYNLLTAYRNAGQLDKAKEEKAVLDRLQKTPEGEFSDFLKKLGEKQPE
ncbi:MAG: tetratricopeptide repeat protein [Bryobacteraceae bacterium]